MQSSRLLAITGATGALGAQVAAQLGQTALRQRLIVRDAARAPHISNAEVVVASGYDNTPAMQAAPSIKASLTRPCSRA
jgi:NAD(P)H dehydrogenase (quinone)